MSATCLPSSRRKALDLALRRADRAEAAALAAQRSIVASARVQAVGVLNDEGDVAAAVLDTIIRRQSTASQQAAALGVVAAWNEGVGAVDGALRAIGITNLPPHRASRSLAVLQAVVRDQARGAWEKAQAEGRLAVRRAALGGRGTAKALRAIFEALLRELERIVLDALTLAFNMGQDERLKELARAGIRGLRKGWAAVNDSRTRASHREAAKRYGPCGDPGPIPVRQRFEVGGARLHEPRDPRGPIKETANCRCKLVPFVERVTAAA